MSGGRPRDLVSQPLTAEAFAPFGEVLDTSGPPTKIINRGMCARHHDLAALDFGPDGRAGISIFQGQPYALPLMLEMVERHPDGSQAFVPMSADPYLVVVAPDEDGVPGRPQVFRPVAGQGVNYRRGVWHGVLTPLERPASFAVIDRIGQSDNLEEHWFEAPWRIVS
ncbi:MAG: ureidoglycolate lyase [Pseudomonadota bacterium]